MTTNNDDDYPNGRIYSVEMLARIVFECSKSDDPDVRAALENLEDVLHRSKVREMQANLSKVRAPRMR